MSLTEKMSYTNIVSDFCKYDVDVIYKKFEKGDINLGQLLSPIKCECLRTKHTVLCTESRNGHILSLDPVWYFETRGDGLRVPTIEECMLAIDTKRPEVSTILRLLGRHESPELIQYIKKRCHRIGIPFGLLKSTDVRKKRERPEDIENFEWKKLKTYTSGNPVPGLGTRQGKYDLLYDTFKALEEKIHEKMPVHSQKIMECFVTENEKRLEAFMREQENSEEAE